MRSRPLAVLLLAAACVNSAAAADKPAVISAAINPNAREEIIVTFSPAVSAATVLRTSWWAIELTTKSTIRTPAVQRSGIVTCSKTVFEWMVSRCPSGEDVVEIALQMATAAGDDVTRVDVRYTGPTGPVRFGADVVKLGASGAVAGAKSAKADDADIAFKGSLTKTGDDDAVNTIDAYAGYMRAIVRPPMAEQKAKYLGRVGFYGQFKSSKSTSAAPDSVLLYGVYQRELGRGGFRGPFQTPCLSVRVPGLELDKEGDQRNWVASPVITLPIRLFTTGRLGALEPGLSIPVLTFQAGTELVKPEHSALGTRNWRARGLLGAALSTGYAPERVWVDSIELTASYVVRVLSDDEVFKDARRAPIDPATGKQGKAVFELGSQKRDLAAVDFTYRPVKWVGLSVKYEYGSEPPVFELKDHTFTFGLAFALKQTSFGRYAILKP